MTKIERVEQYLHEFFTYNIFELNDFYRAVYDQRDVGIYLLPKGNEILDFLINIYLNIEENLNFERLIPHRFATPQNLLYYLQRFIDDINNDRHLVDTLYDGEDTDWIISYFTSYIEKILSAFEYAIEIYDLEDENVLLYQQLRYHLINHDIENFIADLKSVFANVSYEIVKQTEGYYHANVFLILKLLGFNIVPEESTNIGRIDAVIRFSRKIYIMEFKFSEDSDDSQEALNQIIDKDYAAKYRIDNLNIYEIGISFNSKIRNIRTYKESIL
ncbi:PD-(D/E)XK nuclease domain-containing protein [Chryseobacterium sp. G0201]|uniref:PD-(D/E)XK nuclease domain-containing protein n=1 Tax=Chryseobacterium sp. G0201 TaxID=2487065 RepID=UPI000F4DF941|nr:PD-(D/E)XK nuclease domain-containing protein [Chryseobacterium sp. G0201]AZA53764.1 hypothetical protein EG348_12475 [Chryseobacterium sp. G0201]